MNRNKLKCSKKKKIFHWIVHVLPMTRSWNQISKKYFDKRNKTKYNFNHPSSRTKKILPIILNIIYIITGFRNIWICYVTLLSIILVMDAWGNLDTAVFKVLRVTLVFIWLVVTIKLICNNNKKKHLKHLKHLVKL